MNNLFSKITKSNDETLLLTAGILSSDGRLSEDGGRLFIDLVFSGMTPDEAKRKIVEQVIKESKKNR